MIPEIKKILSQPISVKTLPMRSTMRPYAKRDEAKIVILHALNLFLPCVTFDDFVYQVAKDRWRMPVKI